MKSKQKFSKIALSLLALSLVTLPAVSSAATAAPSSDATLLEEGAALQQLARAGQLQSAFIGFAALPSPNLALLRTIVEAEDAGTQLRQLYEEGDLAGKIYALIGLQLKGEANLAATLLDDAAQYAELSLETMEGCVISSVSLGEVLDRVREGVYAESFAATWQM